MPAQDNTEEFTVTIIHMFNGCPKRPSGWFGCFAEDWRDGDSIKLSGTTPIMLIDKMTLNITAVPDITPDRYNKGKYNQPAYKVLEFKVNTADPDSAKAYLMSIKGVDKKIVDKLVRKYGALVIETIKNDPDKVKKTCRIPDKMFEAIRLGTLNTDMRSTLATAFPELTSANIERLIADHATLDKLIDNPFIMHDEHDVSYAVCDAIAERLFGKLSPYRVNHGIVHYLDSMKEIYINLLDTNKLMEFKAGVDNLLMLQPFEIQLNDFAARIMALSQTGNLDEPPVTIHDKSPTEKLLFSTKLFSAIRSIAGLLKRAENDKLGKKRRNNCASPVAGMSKNWLAKAIREYDLNFSSVPLTDEQKNAISTSLSNTLSVITGGPGRGKTSVINAIIYAWDKACRETGTGSVIICLAPTGKAVNKIIDSIDSASSKICCCRTVDKFIMSHDDMLEYHGFGKDCLVIVDEASMIDLMRAAKLISKANCAHFIFVGDTGQLPPIEKGCFLKSIIDSNRVPVSKLTLPLRNNGLVIQNVDKIRDGDTNLKYDFAEMPIFPCENDDEKSLDMVIEQYLDEMGAVPDPIQLALISPIKKGWLGVNALNYKIQSIRCPLNDTAPLVKDAKRDMSVYNTKGYPIEVLKSGSGDFMTCMRVGDLVMNTKNNESVKLFKFTNDDYWNGDIVPDLQKTNLCNGDIGRIIGYVPADGNPEEDHDLIIIQMLASKLVGTFDATIGEMKSFELAYAMTVHKSQGSEYDTVIYVSPKSVLYMNDFATRPLPYTAISRARTRCVVMGSKESFCETIKRTRPDDEGSFTRFLT